MESLSILLVLLSAAMHAGWNAVGKRKVPTQAYFLVTTGGGILLLCATPSLWPAVVSGYSETDVLLVLSAGFFQALYFSGLAGGYRAGDLSMVYPLARSVPAVAVTVGSVLLGRGAEIAPACWIGAGMIVIGCFFVPQARFGSIRLHHFGSTPFLFAMLAAAGTTGYSLVDDTALTRLRAAHPELHPAGVTAVFSLFEVLATAGWLSVIVLSRREGRDTLRREIRDWKRTVATGVVIAVTYLIVLVALAFARDVSYVVAFRQASIPIGVAIGVLFFSESLPAPKVLGTLLIVTGLILVATA